MIADMGVALSSPAQDSACSHHSIKWFPAGPKNAVDKILEGVFLHR
jgi:hypothetical protein